MTKEVASPQKAESSQTSARRGQVEIVGFALFGAFEKFVATRGHRLRVGRRKLLVRRGAGGADRGHRGRLIGHGFQIRAQAAGRSEEPTSELQSLMRTVYAVLRLKHRK